MAKSRRLFFFVCLLSIVLILVYPAPVSYMFLYALILLLGLSIFSVLASSLFIRIKQQTDRYELQKNEDFLLHLEIKNQGLFYYPKINHSFFSEDLIQYGDRPFPPITPRGTIKMDFTLRFPYRGPYKIGLERLRLFDFFGLFSGYYTEKNPVSVLVFPAIDPNLEIPLAQDLLSRESTPYDSLNDPQADVTDVRKYDPSDDKKRIHWKLTAKRGELVTKNFQASTLNRVLLFLDTELHGLSGRQKTESEDRLASAAASAATVLAENLLPVDFFCGNDAGAQSLSGRDDLPAFYRMLAGLTFDSKTDLSAFLSNTARQDDNLYNMILITPALSEKAFLSIRDAAAFGHHIVLYYLTAPEHARPEKVKGFLSALSEAGVDLPVFINPTGTSDANESAAEVL